MYSIYNKQMRRLMSVGRNSATKEDAKYDLLHYVSGELLSRGTYSAIKVDA